MDIPRFVIVTNFRFYFVYCHTVILFNNKLNWCYSYCYTFLFTDFFSQLLLVVVLEIGEVKKVIQIPFKIWKRWILSAFNFMKETGLVDFNAQVVSSSLALYNHQVFCLVGLTPVHTRRQVAETCCGDTSQRQIASCVLEKFLWKSLSLQQNFVAATCCKKSNQTGFVLLIAVTKLYCRDKDFHKKFSCTHEAICRCYASPRHVASTSSRTCTHWVICRRDLLLQLVA